MSGRLPLRVGGRPVPTRGVKGSPASWRAAANLVRRLALPVGSPVDVAVVAPQRAVITGTVLVPGPAAATGRLRVVGAGVRTPGGRGHGFGRPWSLGASGRPGAPGSPCGPVVVLADGATGYREVVAAVAGLRAGGAAVVAVVVATDEGVLVANRLTGLYPGEPGIPVVDLVDVDGLGDSVALAVEVRGPGEALAVLTDPVALAAGLGLRPDERPEAAAVARLLIDRSNAVVALDATAPAAGAGTEAWIDLGDGRHDFRDGCRLLRSAAVGSVRAYGLTAAETTPVDDLFAVDLDEVAERAASRRGTVASRTYLLAALRGGETTDGPALLAAELGVEVRMAPSEGAATRAGALTTPGSRPDDLVVDIGAGTIDAIGADREVVAAGAGEMLTQAVAAALALPRSVSDWVKRGPSLRLESGQRYEAEDGTRAFLDRPAPAALTGRLAVAGPAGLLPFDDQHTPAEWRALRLQLKEAVLGANLRRVLDPWGPGPLQAVVVGGPVADDELLGVVARSLPDPVLVGRGQVGAILDAEPGAPALGSRYAVAVGLCLFGCRP